MNKLTNYLVHLNLCPGDYQETCEICKDCPSCKLRSCKRDLKKKTMELYKAQLSEEGTECKPSESPHSVNLEIRITQILRELGVPAHIKGHNFLRYAIELVIRDPAYQEQITYMLYPEVAKEFDTTASRVERAIRHAIEVTWDRGDLDVLQKWFGYSISIVKGKPTNSEFIARVADTLRMEAKYNG